MNLNFRDLCKSYGGRNIFENLSGQIDDGDKIGIIGSNGIGKTTLVNILTGRETADAGKVSFSPTYIKTLYIEQYPEFEEGVSVYEDILKFCMGLNDNRNMGDIEAAAKKALDKVGLGPERWGQQAKSLSGGEKTKLALSRLFISRFDFLILDEPTNHLDMESSEWLEDYINSLNKPILIISHDRFFLDNTVNRIWELTSRGLEEYEGNYTDYRIQKEIQQKTVSKEYDKQQTRIQELKNMINHRETWYHSAHKSAGQNDYLRARAKKQASTMRAKRSQLERLEKVKIERPPKELAPAFDIINKNVIDRKFPRFLIQGKGISKSFGTKEVLKGASFNVRRGDRIALIGPNGSGKTTFLKILCGFYGDYGGYLRVSPSVNIAYFSQELENLDYGTTILEDVLAEGASIEDTRLLLASLLFRGDEVYKRIANLSMGEKGRVAFAKLILSEANLLVLDEPTNYMDINSKEKIEEALEQFRGSIIFVSHDRYFIKRLGSRVLVIEDKKIRSFDDNYEGYLARVRQKKLGEATAGRKRHLRERVMKLEVELAYLGGKLDESLDEEEKAELNKRYLEIARELNRMKSQ